MCQQFFQTMTAFDAGTGRLRWQFNFRRGSLLDPMTFADGFVYLSLISGQIAALDPKTGKLQIVTERSDSLFFWTYPALDSLRLYGSGLAGFYALKR